jgi:hypothetical protein
VKRRVRLGFALAVLALGAGAGRADDVRKAADPAADDELLEFLGSVDPGSDSAADDGTWVDYLSQTDIGKVVKPAGPSGTDAKPATPAGAPAKPSESGVKKDD